MKYRILIIAALAFPLTACQTDGEPPTGQVTGPICRGATATLGIATTLKARLDAPTRAKVSHGVSIVNQYCDLPEPPALDAIAIITITVALTELLTEPPAPVSSAVAPAAVVDWPTIRANWVAAVVRWNAA